MLKGTPLTLRASKSRESIRLREAVGFLGVDPNDETGIVSPSIKISESLSKLL
jgi:hypothetical protein